MKVIDKKRYPTITEHGIYGFFQEYRFLSNFHLVDIEIDNIIYPSSEHAYIAYKTYDFQLKKEIALIKKPSEIKKFGQTIKLRPDWEFFRVAAMQDCLHRKFQNKDLANQLIQTGSLYLEETNNWNDTFWGVCEQKGLNMLGKNLMLVRKIILDTKKQED